METGKEDRVIDGSKKKKSHHPNVIGPVLKENEKTNDAVMFG